MKLTITAIPGVGFTLWHCELQNNNAYWIGEGITPIEAYEDYLDIVKNLDEEGDFDYEWCKSKGLIK